MKISETIEVITDIIERKIAAPRFSGIMHVEIHCGEGGIRRILVAPQPEKVEYIGVNPTVKKNNC
jgi:hypothetical protein